MAVKSLSGGEKLQARLKKLAARVSNQSTLNVGFLEGATYPDGTPVAMVAAIQEFGAPRAHIPARSPIRRMIADEEEHWGTDLGKLLKSCDYDAGKALELMGHKMKAELQQAIIDTNSPPLSPITIMLRAMRSADQSLVVTGKTVGEAAARVAAGESTNGASTKVLDDTGHMIASVDFEVKS